MGNCAATQQWSGSSITGFSFAPCMPASAFGGRGRMLAVEVLRMWTCMSCHMPLGHAQVGSGDAAAREWHAGPLLAFLGHFLPVDGAAGLLVTFLRM